MKKMIDSHKMMNNKSINSDFIRIMGDYNDNRNELPTVNVYCLVYNHAPYLRKCLDSILNQVTSFSWNIVIHDDASTDGSSGIIREYASKYPNKIKAIIENDNIYQNGGGGAIRSVMKRYLTAKYLANCEGDDYWIDKYKLQKQVEFLEKHPNYSAIYSNVLPIDRNGKHDERLRMGLEFVSKITRYSSTEITDVHLKTQSATLLGWNYYRHMTDEEIKKFSSFRCMGDTKDLMIYGYLGQVGILPNVTAAYRRVISDSGSWSSYYKSQSRIRKIEIGYDLRQAEYDFMDYYFGEGDGFYNWVIGYRMMTAFYSHRKKINDEDKGIIKKIMMQRKIPTSYYFFFLLFVIRQIYRRIKWRVTAVIYRNRILAAGRKI